MPDIRGLVGDPEFKALPPERKRAILQKTGADPRFIDALLSSGEAEAPVEAPSGPRVMRDESGRTLSFPQMEVVRGEHFDPSTPEGKINTALGAASTVAGAGGPIPFLKGAGLSLAGMAAGGYAGRALGGGLEAAGFPAGTSQVLSKAGGAIGSVAGPLGGPSALLRLRAAGGGAGGTLSSLVERFLAKEAGQAATGTAARAGARQAGAAAVKGPVVRMRPTKTLAEAASRHVSESSAPRAEKAFLEFAKKEGPKFKRGERVWFVRDSAGKPVKTFKTSDEASGWMRRKENRDAGYVKDFFQNLWAS